MRLPDVDLPAGISVVLVASGDPSQDMEAFRRAHEVAEREGVGCYVLNPRDMTFPSAEEQLQAKGETK